MVDVGLSFADSQQNSIRPAVDLWKSLPIQNEGRVKPLDTFSRETLKQIYGKDVYKNLQAVMVILSWLVIPEFWDKTKLFFIDDYQIKSSLDLDIKQSRFRFLDLQKNKKLALQLLELQSLKDREASLNTYFKKIQKIEKQLILYDLVKSGFLLRFEPSLKEAQWHNLLDMTKAVQLQFKLVISSYIKVISQHINSLNLQKTHIKNIKTDKQALERFKKEMQSFKKLTFKQANFKPNKIQAEVFYNSFKPFKQAYIFYFLFLLLALITHIFKKPQIFKWIVLVAVIGFVCHSLGLVLRSYIMSRPPVSNMYETVLWVPWVAVLAGFIFYIRSFKITFIASLLLAGFCLLLTSLAPEILDSSMQPLEAVLNSTFWLSTHVVIITMSYAFFFLAFVLGDISLLSYLIYKPSTNLQQSFKTMNYSIYRSLQWGIVLLAGGTILGAIWADLSWGRFWAWDPKESWALISLLAYLALLHAKLVGWLLDFGMAMGAVLMFFTVIMAWYGVNFILGAGLHSYGFGHGGAEYVLGFFVLHLILCAVVTLKKFKMISFFKTD